MEKVFIVVMAVFFSSLFPFFGLYAQPVNDLVCDALEIVLDDPPLQISNAGATVQMGEEQVVPEDTDCKGWQYCFVNWCDHSGMGGFSGMDNSVWFKFATPSSGAVKIDACGSTFNTQLALYDVQDCNDFSTFKVLQAVDERDGCGGTIPYTMRMECLEEGKEYYIVVDGWQNVTGTAVIEGEITLSITTEMKMDPGVNLAGSRVENPLCPGGTEGSIGLLLISGVPPISYQWSNGDSTQTINNLMAGDYTVTVTDFCGTSAVAGFDLEDPIEPESIILSEHPLEVVHPTHCGTGAYGGQVSVLAERGVTPFSYEWSTGATTPHISGLADGSYTVTVTDKCRINQLVKTYHLGMEAGPDEILVEDPFACNIPIGIDNTQTGGDIFKVTYGTDESLFPVSCNAHNSVQPQAFWRAFDLNDFNISSSTTLHAVEFFVQSIPSFINDVGVPIKVSAFLANTTQLDDPDLELTIVDSVEFFVPEILDASSYLTPLSFDPIAPDDIIVIKVEVVAPLYSKHRFGIGTNSTPTAQPTYWSSATCGYPQITPLADASGFPSEMVMNLLLSYGTGLSYQWDNQVDDPTSATPTTTGSHGSQPTITYAVTITDVACGITVTDEVEVTCIVDGTDNPVEASFSISPNPGSGVFQLKNEGDGQEIELRVFDVQGRTVYTGQRNMGSGEVGMLDLTAMANGVYWVKLAREEGVEVHRLMIQ